MRLENIREGETDGVLAQIRRQITDAKFFLFALCGGGAVLKDWARRTPDKMLVIMMCVRKLVHRVVGMIGERQRRHAFDQILGRGKLPTGKDGPLALPLPQGRPVLNGFSLALVEFNTLLKSFLGVVVLM